MLACALLIRLLQYLNLILYPLFLGFQPERDSCEEAPSMPDAIPFPLLSSYMNVLASTIL